MGENICRQCNQQGINLQNLKTNKQTAHVAQYKKKKKPNQKMGRRPVLPFIQRRRHTDGQQAHEKMLNITNY